MHDRDEADVPSAAFDTTDVGAVQTYLQCEGLLGDPGALTMSSDTTSELSLGFLAARCWHEEPCNEDEDYSSTDYSLHWLSITGGIGTHQSGRPR